MSTTLYLGLRLSGMSYKRISYTMNDDDFSTITVENLKKKIVELLENELNHAVAGIELVFCGKVLDDSAELKKEGIKFGCTIHVFNKAHMPEPEQKPFVLTEDNVKIARIAYDKIAFYCQGKSLPRELETEVLDTILEKYPELYNDVGAFGIIKDQFLLSKMVRAENSRLMGEKYPVLIYGAKFIADSIINHFKANATSSRSDTADASDVEMSEHGSSDESGEDQPITRGQLAAALFSAGVGSENNGPQYVAELATMRDMGFMNDSNNLQALILCSGDVQTAVTLIMNTGNFS